MELGENIKDSIAYPISDFKNFIIFTVILLFSFLIIPIPFVAGYIYKVIAETIDGNDTLPEFDDFGDIFINGLKMIGIVLAYGVIIGIIFGIVFGIGGALGSAMGGNAGVIVVMIFSIIAIILALIIGLIALPAPVNMALNNGNFGSAFDFSAITGLISDIGIGNYIIWYIIIAIITGIVSAISGFLIWVVIGILGYAWMSLFEARSTALLFGFE